MSRLDLQEPRFVTGEARPGPEQMALDEVAAETVADGGPPTLRVYRWEPSSLSLGYGQDPGTVDWAFCRRHAVDVTRRQTGGGGIYHDAEGDISYSVVVPATAVPDGLLESYRLLCEPVLAALERLGVEADFATTEQPGVDRSVCYLRARRPAHDLLAAGRKISGNAQYRRDGAVVQHGSLSYACRPERHLGVFAADIDPEAFDDRVTSVRARSGVDRETAVETLGSTLREWAGASAGTWTDTERERAETLAEQKYADDRWVREGVDSG